MAERDDKLAELEDAAIDTATGGTKGADVAIEELVLVRGTSGTGGGSGRITGWPKTQEIRS